MVDKEPYGKLISPHDETKYHVNLAPGTHECYLELLPKDKDEEVYKTNVLVRWSIFLKIILNCF